MAGCGGAMLLARALTSCLSLPDFALTSSSSFIYLLASLGACNGGLRGSAGHPAAERAMLGACPGQIAVGNAVEGLEQPGVSSGGGIVVCPGMPMVQFVAEC